MWQEQQQTAQKIQKSDIVTYRLKEEEIEGGRRGKGLLSDGRNNKLSSRGQDWDFTDILPPTDNWGGLYAIMKFSGRKKKTPKKSRINPISFHLCSMKTDVTAPLYTHLIRCWLQFHSVALHIPLHQYWLTGSGHFSSFPVRKYSQKIHTYVCRKH